jgi:hypothetical protein
MSHDKLIADLQTLGIPVVLLIALGWAIWKSARWFAPRLSELFSAHLALVNKVKDSIDSFGRTLDGMLLSIQAVLKNQEDLRKDLGDIKDHVGITRSKDE